MFLTFCLTCKSTNGKNSHIYTFYMYMNIYVFFYKCFFHYPTFILHSHFTTPSLYELYLKVFFYKTYILLNDVRKFTLLNSYPTIGIRDPHRAWLNIETAFMDESGNLSNLSSQSSIVPIIIESS